MSNAQINNPYVFTQEDNIILAENFHRNRKPWSNAVFNPIKDRIRAHLRPEQGLRCCYCKKILRHDIREVDIEHIVDKQDHEEFTFTSKNLALSCPACNTSKSTTETLFTPDSSNYPSTNTAFRIVHPHFDNYFTNIEIIGDIIIKSLKPKGTRTITICNLATLRKARDKALDKILSSCNPEICQLLQALVLDVNDSELRQRIIDLINDIKANPLY